MRSNLEGFSFDVSSQHVNFFGYEGYRICNNQDDRETVYFRRSPGKLEFSEFVPIIESLSDLITAEGAERYPPSVLISAKLVISAETAVEFFLQGFIDDGHINSARNVDSGIEIERFKFLAANLQYQCTLRIESDPPWTISVIDSDGNELG